jgi:hypothetical protein
MTWLLLIQVVIISTCSEGFRFCPPARPPVESRQVFQTEAACQARAQQYRRHFPAERELTRSAHLRMQQQTTVQCLPQGKG